MKNDSISLAIANSVATITINRPEQRNALNRQVVQELIAAAHRAAKDQSVAVVLLQGAGNEAFCAGADLKELAAENSYDQRLNFFSSIAEVVELFGAMQKPVVAKVRGFAFAGGCGLAAAADITIAGESALFSLPEIHIGLVPMIVMAPIERAIGRKATAYLAMTGERVDAREALRMGLVSRVVPDAELDGVVQTLVSGLASKSPRALAEAKRAVMEIPERDYGELLAELPRRIARLSCEPSATEGIAAFLEKRQAVWRK